MDAHAESGVPWSEALGRLKEGNERYFAGTPEHARADAARRMETAWQSQRPFAALVSCSDSRVPVEILFDQGIGDLFVLRVPGNVCNGDEIGAIEYAVERLGVRLCVVLGHTRCGAVTEVATEAMLEGHVARLVANIRQALVRVRKEEPAASGAELVEAVGRANVKQSISDLLQGSRALRERAAEGTFKVVGAIYDIASGHVEWFGDA